MIITTTNSVENSSIQKYFELVSTNVVIGTNFFSDFGASLSDIFGGFSNTYQNNLQRIYQVAIANLQEKAKRLGANAVIGLKIDFDEISGKGKSMFMVSAIGTAVLVEMLDNKQLDSNIHQNNISFEALENEVRKRIIAAQLSKEALPDEEQWQYLLNNPSEELLAPLLKCYLQLPEEGIIEDRKKLLLENFTDFISRTDRNIAVQILYPHVTTDYKKISAVLRRNKLFDAQEVINLIKDGQIKYAIRCMAIDKEYYTAEDLGMMKEIVNTFTSLPDTGKIETVKGGILSKDKEMYICQHGHKNDIEYTFCRYEGCYINIKGIHKAEAEVIDAFILKTQSLEYLLSKQEK